MIDFSNFFRSWQKGFIRHIFRNILLLAALISCSRQNTKAKIQFYHRMLSENNHVISSSDFLAISKYSDSPLSAMQLYAIAVKYHDTVKTKYQVKSITFMAKDVTGPDLYWDSEIWTHEKKYCLIDFDFEYQQNKRDSLELNTITLWKDSHPYFFNVGRDKEEMDSILSSPVPIAYLGNK
jgi:hypothetical protein